MKKTDPNKLKNMTHAGIILGNVLDTLMNSLKPGMTELEIDQKAEQLIREQGGEPGFQRVQGYKHTICISTNDVVVHGIPTNRILQEGDIVGVDCGVYYNGYHTDMAESIQIGKRKDSDVQKFLEAGKRAMFMGISKARVGNRVGDISHAIQEIVEKEGGYSIVRSLVGHGVGKELHEEPEIPGYLEGKIDKTPKLVAGMTIAVEVIYNMGGRDVVYEGTDDWTIVTADGSISGLFERTIVIEDEGPRLITARGSDEIGE